MLNTARVEEGATVLVLGLGGIGLSVVQGACLASAARIIVSDPVHQRREVAKALGASHAIDPTQDDVVSAARDLTAGIGAGPAMGGDGGWAWQVRAGATLEIGGGISVMFGYRLLELDVEDETDYEFDAGLQGLFIAGSIRF